MPVTIASNSGRACSLPQKLPQARHRGCCIPALGSNWGGELRELGNWGWWANLLRNWLKKLRPDSTLWFLNAHYPLYPVKELETARPSILAESWCTDFRSETKKREFATVFIVSAAILSARVQVLVYPVIFLAWSEKKVQKGSRQRCSSRFTTKMLIKVQNLPCIARPEPWKKRHLIQTESTHGFTQMIHYF